MDLSWFKYTGSKAELVAPEEEPRGTKRDSHHFDDDGDWHGPLPHLLQPDLDFVFIGFNPGLESARRGHYYAHPSNRFWKFIYRSGFVTRPVTFDDDRRFPQEYNFGFTDLVARSTKGITQLTSEEMAEGVELLDKRLSKVSPRNVCLIGKGIWEAIAKARNWSRKDFNYGKQPQTFGGNAALWVFPSTSGLNSMSAERQLSYWKEASASLQEAKSQEPLENVKVENVKVEDGEVEDVEVENGQLQPLVDVESEGEESASKVKPEEIEPDIEDSKRTATGSKSKCT